MVQTGDDADHQLGWRSARQDYGDRAQWPTPHAARKLRAIRRIGTPAGVAVEAGRTCIVEKIAAAVD